MDKSFGGPDGSEAVRTEELIYRVSPGQVRSAATFEVPMTALGGIVPAVTCYLLSVGLSGR